MNRKAEKRKRGEGPKSPRRGRTAKAAGAGKPAVHLICNAHLDPVWQWRWEEGAAEALATFRNAVTLLGEHSDFVFCHNEAVLYRWVERYDPPLFRAIRRLVGKGRWAISGGWFLQPDVNLPGTESLIRHIAEGRLYFRDIFGVEPRVAYNFDSFGHSGGLPQILRGAGYELYVHMRPQSHELALPADLYRWRGVDGTVIPAYRISVGLYHTERDNIEERLRAGVGLALELGRDVPLFWGLGNHGGGATRDDLRKIDAFIRAEDRVRIRHSTPEIFLDSVRKEAERAPVFEGDLQRSFTGCYTSLSRLKRRAVSGAGQLVRAESAAAAAWWLRGAPYPEEDLREGWRDHLFNDFHDIITGTCVEPAEGDALDLYGKSGDLARGTELAAAAALNRGRGPSPGLPLTVLHANPAAVRVPIECECQVDYRPLRKGRWRLRLCRIDGTELPCQEEPPEPLLPFNDWRRRVCFVDTLPGVGVSRYVLEAVRGEAAENRNQGEGAPEGPLEAGIDGKRGLVTSLRAGPSRTQCLAGPLLQALVIDDAADSWGTGKESYRRLAGRFEADGPPVVLADGPVRTITRASFGYGKSRIVMDVVSCPDRPVLEFRLRIVWNEEGRRLKLRVPTRLRESSVFCEVPGGAIHRPADGREHVHGRWLALEGIAEGRPLALGVVTSGQHGFDVRRGEIRLSVLRSAAYCHERGFKLGSSPVPKFSDIGVHDVRILVTAGRPGRVRESLPGLADSLSAPPRAFPHLPILHKDNATPLLDIAPPSVRLLASKRSWDGRALIVRLQEPVGRRTRVVLAVFPGAGERGGKRTGRKGRKGEPVRLALSFRPFEIKTLRFERPGPPREVRMIEETG